jgi:hypothetical protein
MAEGRRLFIAGPGGSGLLIDGGEGLNFPSENFGQLNASALTRMPNGEPASPEENLFV